MASRISSKSFSLFNQLVRRNQRLLNGGQNNVENNQQDTNQIESGGGSDPALSTMLPLQINRLMLQIRNQLPEGHRQNLQLVTCQVNSMFATGINLTDENGVAEFLNDVDQQNITSCIDILVVLQKSTKGEVKLLVRDLISTLKALLSMKEAGDNLETRFTEITQNLENELNNNHKGRSVIGTMLAAIGLGSVTAGVVATTKYAFSVTCIFAAVKSVIVCTLVAFGAGVAIAGSVASFGVLPLVFLGTLCVYGGFKYLKNVVKDALQSQEGLTGFQNAVNYFYQKKPEIILGIDAILMDITDENLTQDILRLVGYYHLGFAISSSEKITQDDLDKILKHFKIDELDAILQDLIAREDNNVNVDILMQMLNSSYIKQIESELNEEFQQMSKHVEKKDVQNVEAHQNQAADLQNIENNQSLHQVEEEKIDDEQPYFDIKLEDTPRQMLSIYPYNLNYGFHTETKNNCFINAALQMIFCNKEFIRICLNHPNEEFRAAFKAYYESNYTDTHYALIIAIRQHICQGHYGMDGEGETQAVLSAILTTKGSTGINVRNIGPAQQLDGSLYLQIFQHSSDVDAFIDFFAKNANVSDDGTASYPDFIDFRDFVVSTGNKNVRALFYPDELDYENSDTKTRAEAALSFNEFCEKLRIDNSYDILKEFINGDVFQRRLSLPTLYDLSTRRYPNSFTDISFLDRDATITSIVLHWGSSYQKYEFNPGQPIWMQDGNGVGHYFIYVKRGNVWYQCSDRFVQPIGDQEKLKEELQSKFIRNKQPNHGYLKEHFSITGILSIPSMMESNEVK